MNRLIALCFLMAAIPACGDESCSFRESKVSPDEGRVLALAGVHEWKCDYALGSLTGGEFSNTFMLFAELYHGTNLALRYRLALPVMDSKLPINGVISIGWNNARHELTGIVENGQMYSPWTYGPTSLPDFSPINSLFFDPSQPELRKSEYPGSPDFFVYPVLGVRGNSMHKVNFTGVATSTDFLNACQHSMSRDALLIYVYKGMADPPLHFEKNQEELSRSPN